MRIKVTDPVLDYEGQPLKDENDKPIIWRNLINKALNNQIANDDVFTDEYKTEAYQISHKLYMSNEPKFTAQQTATIVKRLKGYYNSPLIFGQAEELFNGKKLVEEAEDEDKKEPGEDFSNQVLGNPVED